MHDPRSVATNVAGLAVAVVGAALLLAGVVFAFRGGGAGLLAGVAVGFVGLVVLAGAWLFLLVPFKVDELAEEHRVSPADEEPRGGR